MYLVQFICFGYLNSRVLFFFWGTTSWIDTVKAFASSGSGAYMFKLPYFKAEDPVSWSGNGYYDSANSKKEIYDTGIELVFGNGGEEELLLNGIMSAWGNMTKTG